MSTSNKVVWHPRLNNYVMFDTLTIEDAKEIILHLNSLLDEVTKVIDNNNS